MKHTYWSLLAGLALMMGLTSSGLRAEEENDDEKEEKIELKDVPEAVLKAAQAAVKDIVFSKAEKETKGEKVTYELKGKAGEKTYEVEVSAEGKVLEVEEEDDDDKDDDDKAEKSGNK
ncbi:MAG: hypothetical protein AMXMBFR7_04290 [Planctomycetota bacterium]